MNFNKLKRKEINESGRNDWVNWNNKTLTKWKKNWKKVPVMNLWAEKKGLFALMNCWTPFLLIFSAPCFWLFAVVKLQVLRDLRLLFLSILYIYAFFVNYLFWYLSHRLGWKLNRWVWISGKKKKQIDVKFKRFFKNIQRYISFYKITVFKYLKKYKFSIFLL